MRQLWILTILFFSRFIQASLLVIATNDTFIDRPAAFGPRVSRQGQVGYLMEPIDPTGCQWVEAPTENWIALLRRGGCSFITKVRTMQQSGAIAVVIGDHQQQQWVTMYAPGDTSDIHIPSFFLAQHEYRSILYLSKVVDTPMMILMKLDDFMTWPLLDMLMIIFISPAIMMTFIYVSYKIRQRQRRLQEIAPMNVVSRLTIKQYHHEKRLENQAESCAICLEDYHHGEEIRVLPCNHDFHPMCVDAWLTTQKKYCPLCKVNITFHVNHTNNHQEITPLIHPIVV
ncbi:uncharacterized protein BX664DRAFT_272245 [Halteromyces radiatus]|uniref:uncharacterized protein n=1 Tax=Halteromyces radiatus TaxID=101107 RepID=UPI002220B67D|nr:uncharacterized protein BX664DRAFT_272245 [Halteromyces radiatus]KAI8099157.1 hypothetical protein BX664DRAFT_272245 [Halteromyces radiatus]